MVKGNHGIAAVFVALNRGTVDDQGGERAAVVAVDEANAPAHGFDDVFFLGRGDMRDAEAGAGSNVLEDRHWRARFAGLRGAGNG